MPVGDTALDPGAMAELEELMKEFPDWKDKYPDLYDSLHPPTYGKASWRADENNNNNYNNSNESGGHVTFNDVTKSAVFPAYSRHAECGVGRMTGEYYGSTRPPGVAKFANQTTTRETYKWWNSDPVAPFTELPTFSNYLIYPGRGRHFSTTSQSTFRGEAGERPDPIIPPWDNDILPTSRARMELTTTTGETYKGHLNAARAVRSDRTPRDTSYLTTYIQNMDAQRIHQQTGVPVPRLYARPDVKFDDRTMNREHYKPWPVEPRRAHGDRYEPVFQPSTCPFDGTTTNTVTYRGVQQAPDTRAPAGKSTGRPGQVDCITDSSQQPRDFNTAYRSDFNRPSIIRNLSQSQAAVLLRELRMRKRQREENGAGKTGVKMLPVA